MTIDEPQSFAQRFINSIYEQIVRVRWAIGAYINGWRFGRDGSLTVRDGETVYLTREMNFRNLTIKSGGTLVNRQYRIYVHGVLDISAGDCGIRKA